LIIDIAILAAVVEDVGGPQPTAAQSGRGEKTDVINPARNAIIDQ